MMPTFASTSVQTPRGMKFHVVSVLFCKELATEVVRTIPQITTLMTVSLTSQDQAARCRVRATYKPPSRKTPHNINRSRKLLRFSLKTSGIGNERTMTSVRILQTAYATQN